MYAMIVPKEKIVETAKICAHLGDDIEFSIANADTNQIATKLFFDTIKAEKNRSSKNSI